MLCTFSCIFVCRVMLFVHFHIGSLSGQSGLLVLEEHSGTGCTLCDTIEWAPCSALYCASVFGRQDTIKTTQMCIDPIGFRLYIRHASDSSFSFGPMAICGNTTLNPRHFAPCFCAIFFKYCRPLEHKGQLGTGCAVFYTILFMSINMTVAFSASFHSFLSILGDLTRVSSRG